MVYGLRVVPKRKRRAPFNEPSGSIEDLPLKDYRPDRGSEDGGFTLEVSPRIRMGLDGISAAAEYSKGDVLFFEGERPGGVYILDRGRVKLSAGSADGRSLLVRTAESGEIIGLAAAISGKPSEVSAEALADVWCSFIVREAFLEFLQQHGGGALRVAEMLAAIYQATLDQVRYLGFSASTSEKLARFLLDRQEAAAGDNGESSPIRMTHKEIAGMIGSSRETVTRMVGKFKRDRLVRIEGNDLRIINRAGLEQMVGR